MSENACTRRFRETGTTLRRGPAWVYWPVAGLIGSDPRIRGCVRGARRGEERRVRAISKSTYFGTDNHGFRLALEREMGWFKVPRETLTCPRFMYQLL